VKNHETLPATAAGLRTMPRAVTLAVAVMAASTALLVAGCGKKEAKATQVIAKVNGDEITGHQLEYVLQQQRVPANGPQAEQMKKQLLDRMIDQQLIVQRAEKEKLDRDPRVMQALDATRRDVLTRFYIEQFAEKTPKPTPAEVKAWYDSKPEQYADRKNYVIQKVDATVPADKRDEVVAKMQAATSAAAVTDWLKAQNIKFNVSSTNQPSETLGPLLVKVSAMKEGQSMAVPQGFGVTVLTLQSIAPAAVTFDQAKGQIEQQLWNERKRDGVMKELKGLKDGAKIEYVGAFAASAPGAGAGTATPPAAPVAPASAAPAPAPAASAAASGMDAATLQKGLGIK
jgi:EpsD family peptidyl-prolyl cis-trans isomerase